jgi:hypothetical protein
MLKETFALMRLRERERERNRILKKIAKLTYALEVVHPRCA